MKEDNKKEKGEVTRRDFLTGAGAAVVGAAVGAGIAYPLASGGTETVTTTDVVENTKTVQVPTTVVSTVPGGTVTETTTQTATTTKTVEVQVPGEAAVSAINLTVNGRQYSLNVEPQCTLQEMLRDKLGFTSVKNMCTGYGACGSCSVIVDGRPVLSCMTLACECDGLPPGGHRHIRLRDVGVLRRHGPPLRAPEPLGEDGQRYRGLDPG